MSASQVQSAVTARCAETREPWTPSRWNHLAFRKAMAPETAFALGNRMHHLATTAYPVGHAQTFRPYRLGGSATGEAEAFVVDTFAEVDRMGLYVHIPFCQKRCRYCEYAVVQAPTEDDKSEYVRALRTELQLTASRIGRKRLVGLDIGGGTPALLAPARLGEILETMDQGFDREPGFQVSIETTPALAASNPLWLRATRRLGIERISMGVQTADHRLLKMMEREAGTLDDNAQAAANVRRAGFDEFNVDVMYGFAGQDAKQWEETLRHAVGLEPDCITTYRVRFKGTRIEGDAREVSLEDVNCLYQATGRVLGEAGYHAEPGKNTYSRRPGSHGLSAYLAERVLHGTPYLGVGLGAQSFTGNLLAYNLGAASKNLEGYLGAVRSGSLPLQDAYFLPREEGMAKMISVSMYSGGIGLRAFHDLFGVTLQEQFPREVAFVLEHGLMTIEDGALRLTAQGALACHGCLALFYSDAVKRYLAERATC